MNIEITDLDMILNYLETTSLEPHDDYSSEFTYKDQKILYKYIKQLQQENKQLKNNWNKLKEYIQKDYNFFGKLIAPEYGCAMGALNRVKDKMQELEQGRDNQ